MSAGYAIVHADTIERFTRTMGQSGGASAYMAPGTSMRTARAHLAEFEDEAATCGEYALIDLEDFGVVT